MPGYVRAAERREQLLRAADEVLIRDGLDHLTLRSVAAEAGVRLSTLQYIFPSRAELVRALAEKVLADVGHNYSGLVTGSGGLAHELRRVAHWYATDVLSSPGMVELLRSEFVATVGRVASDEPIDYPLGRPLLGGYVSARVLEIGARCHEEYALPLEDLARLWTQIMTGLTYEFLSSPDLDRFGRDALFVVDRMVEVARPRPVR